MITKSLVGLIVFLMLLFLTTKKVGVNTNEKITTEFRFNHNI